MGFFHAKPTLPTRVTEAPQASPLPRLQIDFSKRYDVYVACHGEERVYENVRFLATRSFDTRDGFRYSISDFLEIEGADGVTAFLPSLHIQTICEHGLKPSYRVVRQQAVW